MSINKTMRAVARVKEIWRYPVKSMGGESVSSCLVTASGLVGDRLWAVTDIDGDIKSARQWPRLIEMAAHYQSASPTSAGLYTDEVPDVMIQLPDGANTAARSADTAELLSAFLGRPCRLEPVRPPSDTAFYSPKKARDMASLSVELDQLDDETALDFSQTPEEIFALLTRYMTPPGTYFDSFPLHIVSEGALTYLASQAGVDADVRRFRPNLLLEFFDTDDPGAEFSLVGRTVRIGGATVAPQGRTIRCSIPSRPQPVLGLEAAPGMTRAMVDLMQRHVGVYSNTLAPGVISVGDEVFVDVAPQGG